MEGQRRILIRIPIIQAENALPQRLSYTLGDNLLRGSACIGPPCTRRIIAKPPCFGRRARLPPDERKGSQKAIVHNEAYYK